MNFDGLRFTVQHGARARGLTSPLVGKFNAYNILAACGAALSYGLDWKTIARAIATSPRVPGRFESIQQGQPFLIVVDYAHTDDALRNVISVARELHPKRVITLFGCGGDATDQASVDGAGSGASQRFCGADVRQSAFGRSHRDHERRAGWAFAVLTHRTSSSRTAPRPSVRRSKEANAGDIVILAGKGHETYQVLKDRVIHFDDREVARGVLEELGWSSK